MMMMMIFQGDDSDGKIRDGRMEYGEYFGYTL
jgi:hypothetical protein